MMRTDQYGAIEVRLAAERIAIGSARSAAQRYWHATPARSLE